MFCVEVAATETEVCPVTPKYTFTCQGAFDWSGGYVQVKDSL